jgi:hypothetical protein
LPGRCERHLFDPAPPPCGGCKDARLAWELGRADEKAREASAALDAVAARSRALAKQEARAVAASRLAFEAEQERLIEATLGVPHEQARCTDCWGEPAAAGAGCRHFEDHRTLIHLTLNAREIPADPADLCPVCGGTRKIVTEDGEELFCTHSRGSIARWAPDGPAPAADGAAA